MTFFILVYFSDFVLMTNMCLKNNMIYILIKIFDKTCTLHVCLIGDEIEYLALLYALTIPPIF